MCKRWLILIVAVNVTACTSIGNFYDRTDPCQTRAELGRPDNYQQPSYCGAGGKTQTKIIYDSRGRLVGYVK